MADGAFRALLGIDLHRMRGHLARGILFTLAAMALSLVAGYRGPVDVAVVLIGCSFYYFLWPPLAAMVDRLEGGLEFLVSVPVSAGTVARARLTGIAIALLPVALYLATAFAIALGPGSGLDPGPGSTTVVFLLAWVSVTGLSGLASGMIIRWGVGALGRWPVAAAILGLGVIVLVGDRQVDAIQSFLTGLLARTGWAWGLVGLTALVALVSVGLAYRLTATGLERFRPERGLLKA